MEKTIITSIKNYDNKRNKVTFDEGAVTLLLYKGECRSLHLAEGVELNLEEYRRMIDEVLKPRAKKRILYYLKSGDKTVRQIKDKLSQNYYPDEVIEDVLDFLAHYKLTDDERYSEDFIGRYKESLSRREIEAKLMAKGISGEAVQKQLGNITEEDEYAACLKAFLKRCGRKEPEALLSDPAEKRRTYAWLASKGFGSEAIQHAFSHTAD